MTVIFRGFDRKVAEVVFPSIDYLSTAQERHDAAWTYTLDLLRDDPMVLTEAFIGEYLEKMSDMDDYHQAVVTALADEDYPRMGALVADAFSALHIRAVDYVEQYHDELRQEVECG